MNEEEKQVTTVEVRQAMFRLAVSICEEACSGTMLDQPEADFLIEISKQVAI